MIFPFLSAGLLTDSAGFLTFPDSALQSEGLNLLNFPS